MTRHLLRDDDLIPADQAAVLERSRELKAGLLEQDREGRP